MGSAIECKPRSTARLTRHDWSFHLRKTFSALPIDTLDECLRFDCRQNVLERGLSWRERRKTSPWRKLKILELLWERGPHVRQITDSLYPDGGASKYATAPKAAGTLEEAEFVSATAAAGFNRLPPNWAATP